MAPHITSINQMSNDASIPVVSLSTLFFDCTAQISMVHHQIQKERQRVIRKEQDCDLCLHAGSNHLNEIKRIWGVDWLMKDVTHLASSNANRAHCYCVNWANSLFHLLICEQLKSQDG